MKITKTNDEQELTVYVTGHIDILTSKDLDDEIACEMGNFNSLIIDFADVDYISSAGLRFLIVTQKNLKANNIPFVIRNVRDSVGKIIKMSGIDKILTII